MRCRFCGAKASGMISGNPSCMECYPRKFEEKVRKTIKRFGLIEPGDRVLVGVSGGKDSAALAGVLSAISDEIGFELEGLYIDLGIKGYSDKSWEAVRSLSSEIGMKITRLSSSSYIGLVPEKRGRKPACSVCGSIKRYIINKFAFENHFTKIAMGHTSDDIIESFMRNIASGYLMKLQPYLPGNVSAVPRIRPLFETTEKENQMYVMSRDLPWHGGECPLADLKARIRNREIVWDIERHLPGFRRGVLRFVASIPVESRPYRKCSICGYPSSGEICAVCRMRGEGSNIK